MAKEEIKAVEEAEVTEVQEVQEEQAKAMFGVILVVGPEGELNIQDAYKVFDGQVENELTNENFVGLIKTLAADIEQKEFESKVQAALANSLGGGKK